MQSTKLPASTCANITACIRNFIWGTTSEHKSVHLVKWQSLCQPKNCGGCGIKDLQAHNNAFLMKLAYNIVAQPTLLWVQVLRAKYRWEGVPNLEDRRSNASRLWRSLEALWEDVKIGLMWQVGNGKHTKFWTDNWVGELGPLCNIAYAPISDEDKKANVAQFYTEGAWLVEKFQHLLPDNIVQKIMEKILADTSDKCTWDPGNQGVFSVHSAYSLLMQDAWNEATPQWDLAWQWPGPQRIQTFLWLALSDKLLTNEVRVRRHMTDCIKCAICGKEPEDLYHILRTCTLASECWNLLVPDEFQPQFRSGNGYDWLRRNLKTTAAANSSWCILFGVLCWKLWDARNKQVFCQTTTQSHRLVNECIALSNHISQAKRLYEAINLG